MKTTHQKYKNIRTNDNNPRGLIVEYLAELSDKQVMLVIYRNVSNKYAYKAFTY